jgi:proteasome assembly chaperone (PAC2) family protein
LRQGHTYKIFETPRLQNPCLVVGWNQDVGGLGSKTLEFLIKKLNAREFARINPAGFFSLSGVPVEENVIQFPNSKFYFCEEKDLLIFHSDGPSQSHYEFLTMLLDIAGQTRPVKEMYTLGGIISLMAHNSPRRVSSVVNQHELKQSMAELGTNTNLEYDTPVGARPTFSSLLLWVAQKKNVTGANLWVEVPFYLAALEDPRACKQVLSVLDRRFGLGLDFAELDQDIARQDHLIADLKEKESDVHRYLTMLEKGIMLSEKESEALANKVAEFLQKRA